MDRVCIPENHIPMDNVCILEEPHPWYTIFVTLKSSHPHRQYLHLCRAIYTLVWWWLMKIICHILKWRNSSLQRLSDLSSTTQLFSGSIGVRIWLTTCPKSNLKAEGLNYTKLPRLSFLASEEMSPESMLSLNSDKSLTMFYGLHYVTSPIHVSRLKLR